MVMTLMCAFFWLRSVDDPSFRRHLRSTGSVDHPSGLLNITSEWCWLMFLLMPSFFFAIEPSSFESSASSVLRFSNEWYVEGFVGVGYIIVASMSILCIGINMPLPIIEIISHRRMLLPFRCLIVCLFSLSIAGQLVSGFIHRPLDMFLDFRLNSLLVVQMIGFILCLFSSFIIGVIYASVHLSEAPLRTS